MAVARAPSNAHNCTERGVQVSEGNPSLKMDELRREYAFAAKAFAAGPDADKVFFFEAALEVTQKPFAMLQVCGAAGVRD
jgi:hypothetical protein